jgi:hypothetical protein
MKKLIALLSLAFYVNTNAQIITTVVGNGTATFAGDNGQATAASLSLPKGVVFDASGNMYIVDENNNRVRKVNTSGVITTVAGNATQGFGGDNGPATAASLYTPTGMTIGAAGNLVIADEDNFCIRSVNSAGTIKTIAGQGGAPGFSGDGGQATAATLIRPYATEYDAAGNLYITDTQNNRIRKVSTTGIITTIAGTATGGYAGDNGPATAAELNSPLALAFDTVGNLYIADAANNCVRMINTAGVISTFAGTGTAGYNGDGVQATSAQLNNPVGLVFDAYGNLFISDGNNSRIRKVDGGTGIISTIAGSGVAGYSGDGGLATAAELHIPVGMAFDASGNLYFADASNNRIRKITAACRVIIKGTTDLCSGQGTVLTASGASSYTWSANAGSVNTNTIGVSPTSNTTYTLYSSGATCTGTNTVTVNVTATPTITISGDTVLCTGTGTTLTGSGSTSYTWSANAGSVTTNTAAISPTATDTYTLTGINGNCTNSSAVTVTVIPSPVITSLSDTVCSGSQGTLSVSGASTYSWSPTPDFGNSSGSTILSTPTVTTVYMVTGTATNSCVGTTTVAIVVNQCTLGIDGFNKQNAAFQIYPNPAQNNFTVETTSTGKQTLYVFDINGNQILSQTFIGKSLVDISNLSAGVYSIGITNNNGLINKRLVIVR